MTSRARSAVAQGQGARRSAKRRRRPRARVLGQDRRSRRTHGNALLAVVHAQPIAAGGQSDDQRAAERRPRRERASASSSPCPPTSRLLNRCVLLRRLHPVASCCGAAAAQAGRGLPSIEAGHATPGRHRADAPQLRVARRGPGTRRLRRDDACRCRSRRGRCERGHRRPAGCWSRCSSTAAPIRSRSSFRPATDKYRACARRWRSRRTRGTPFADDPRLCWHPAARASPPCTVSRSSPSCRRSATRTPTSRTSRPATSGRSARPTRQLQTGWLGRVLDRIGHDDNPLQGLSLELRALARARDARASRSPSLDSPEGFNFWTPKVGATSRRRCSRAVGELGRPTGAAATRRCARRRR